MTYKNFQNFKINIWIQKFKNFMTYKNDLQKFKNFMTYKNFKISKFHGYKNYKNFMTYKNFKISKFHDLQNLKIS